MENIHETSSYLIAFKESTDFSSSFINFEYGKSFKTRGRQSVGVEETGIKNYASGVSMNARFDNLDTLSKSISATLMWKESAGGDDYNYTEFRNATTNLQLNAAFSGRGHIGVRQLNSSMQDVSLLVDEDYSGTYSIAQNLTHVSRLDLKAYADHWLPCCSMGFGQMNPLDQKIFKSAQGIFDCTCFLLPKTS
jgi:hypothetical protein